MDGYVVIPCVVVTDAFLILIIWPVVGVRGRVIVRGLPPPTTIKYSLLIVNGIVKLAVLILSYSV